MQQRMNIQGARKAPQMVDMEDALGIQESELLYVFNTPEDPLRSADCVRQRSELIRRNLEYLKERR